MELGRAGTHWESLVAHIEVEFEPLDQTWTYAGTGWGWTLRLKQKKRTVLYMTPRHRQFVVGFALGERAVRAAHASDLPEGVLSLIDSAKKYAEGRAARLEVRYKKDLDAVKTLTVIKMAN